MAEEEKVEHPPSNFTFSCNLCDLVFKSESELDNHTEEKHGNNVIEKEKKVASNVISENTETNLPKADKNVFQCDECNYKSSSERNFIVCSHARDADVFGSNVSSSINRPIYQFSYRITANIN